MGKVQRKKKPSKGSKMSHNNKYFDDDSEDDMMGGIEVESEREVTPERDEIEEVRERKIASKKILKPAKSVPVAEEGKESVETDVTKYPIGAPVGINIRDVKNKLRKIAMSHKMKMAKKLARKELKKLKRKEKQLYGDKIVKKVPDTIESKREEDITITNIEDEDLLIEEKTDKFSSYYRKSYEPKVLITVTDRIHGKTIKFIKDLTLTIPNATSAWRSKLSLKKIVNSAPAQGYTDIIVINEDKRKANGMLVIHLPEGPTAMFRLSDVKVCNDIHKKSKDITGHRPELIFNNFRTRLGHSVARMLGSLYHYEPEFRGRSVCTFHNQRDYIFVRHHRYEFKNTEKAKLRELGPRFTLKLEWLQDGIFDGDFEWSMKRRQMETSRLKFQL